MRRVVLSIYGFAFFTVSVSFLSGSFLSAAQITSHLVNGRRVFVNADEPAQPQKSKASKKASVLVKRDATGDLVEIPARVSEPAVAAAPASEARAEAPAESTAPVAASDPDIDTPFVPSLQASLVAPGHIDEMISATAERHELNEAVLRALIKQESNFNPRAISYKGAMGLMQLMPATARQLGVRNAFDPAQNLDGGARYLKSLLSKYEGDLRLSLAAYNAGPGAVQRYNGVPPYRETQQYVRRISALSGAAAAQVQRLKEPARFDVMKWVDANGRVHFSNTEGN